MANSAAHLGDAVLADQHHALAGLHAEPAQPGGAGVDLAL
jgi:hypothetical protein